MGTLQEIRNKANPILTEFWTRLQTKQDAYFAKHGKYFQLLVTNQVVDGVDTVFEVRHPSDEKHLADVDFSFNLDVPFAISVDEWVGDTVGYRATATITLLDDRVFSRTRNSLGEDTNWVEVIYVAPN